MSRKIHLRIPLGNHPIDGAPYDGAACGKREKFQLKTGMARGVNCPKCKELPVFKKAEKKQENLSFLEALEYEIVPATLDE